MSPLADDTFDGLATVPDSARETPNSALEQNVLVQGHANYTSTGLNLTETGMELMCGLRDLAKGSKRKMNGILSGFQREIMHKNACHERIGFSNIKHVDTVQIDGA